jgi:hypothetical protein
VTLFSPVLRCHYDITFSELGALENPLSYAQKNQSKECHSISSSRFFRFQVEDLMGNLVRISLNRIKSKILKIIHNLCARIRMWPVLFLSSTSSWISEIIGIHFFSCAVLSFFFVFLLPCGLCLMTHMASQQFLCNFYDQQHNWYVIESKKDSLEASFDCVWAERDFLIWYSRMCLLTIVFSHIQYIAAFLAKGKDKRK